MQPPLSITSRELTKVCCRVKKKHHLVLRKDAQRQRRPFSFLSPLLPHYINKETTNKTVYIMAHSSSFSSATLLEQSIFLLFMIFWIIYGILNQYTSIHKITFDPVAVVWSQEVLKIILSLILFVLQDGNLLYLYKDVKQF